MRKRISVEEFLDRFEKTIDEVKNKNKKLK